MVSKRMDPVATRSLEIGGGGLSLTRGGIRPSRRGISGQGGMAPRKFQKFSPERWPRRPGGSAGASRPPIVPPGTPSPPMGLPRGFKFPRRRFRTWEPSEGLKRELSRKARSLYKLLEMMNISVGDLEEFVNGKEFPGALAPVGAANVWTHPRYTRTLSCGRDPFNAKSQNATQGLCSNLLIESIWNGLPAWPPAGSINVPNISPITNLKVQTAPGPPPQFAYRTNGYYTRVISGSTGAWVRKAILAEALVSAEAMVSTRTMTTAVRSRRVISKTAGFRRPAVEMVAVADPKGEMQLAGPPVLVTHRVVPSKTQKKGQTAKALAKLIGGYHAMTEINDFFESLADAIPGKPCSAKPGFQRALCVLENFDKIDPKEAAVNLFVNEIEDRLVGAFMGQLGQLTKAGGPKTTQMNQFLRQLGSYTKGVL